MKKISAIFIFTSVFGAFLMIGIAMEKSHELTLSEAQIVTQYTPKYFWGSRTAYSRNGPTMEYLRLVKINGKIHFFIEQSSKKKTSLKYDDVEFLGVATIRDIKVIKNPYFVGRYTPALDDNFIDKISHLKDDLEW